MDWSFTDEQDELAALARRILTDKLPEERMREIEASNSRIDFSLLRELADAGVVGIALPSEVGGGGYGLIEQCRVAIELGRAVAPVPVLSSIVLGAMPLAQFGLGDQRQWARAAAAGEVVLTAALIEEFNPHARQPLTTAARDGSGWVLNGMKTNVPAGPAAESILVPASTDEGVTVFLVEPSDDGVTIAPQEVTNKQIDGQLQLNSVALGDERVLGEVGQGAEIVAWILRRAIVATCAHQLGVCERAVELTAEYSKQRVQFERPIATFQAVGQRLADAYIDAEGIRLTLWQAAWRLSEDLPCDTEIDTAKFWASDAGHRIAHTAVHVHGGVGIDLDYPLHRYFIAAKHNEFSLGTATDHLRRIGATLAAEPA